MAAVDDIEDQDSEDTDADIDMEEELDQELNYVNQIECFLWYKGDRVLRSLKDVQENLDVTDNENDKLLYIQYKRMDMMDKDLSERNRTAGKEDMVESWTVLCQEGSFDVLQRYIIMNQQRSCTDNDALWRFSYSMLKKGLQNKELVEEQEEIGREAFAQSGRDWKRKAVLRL